MINLKLTSGRRAGMECGASGAKLVLLSKRDSAFQVENIFIENYLFEARVKGKTLAPLDIVRRLLIHKNLAGYQVVFTASDAVKSCFTILPKMSRAEMEGAILLQARKLLSWESAHPLMAHISSEFLGNHTGNLVGLADWAAVKPWGRLIEGSGGEVNDLTLEACAYQTLASRQAWDRESPVFLVADIGAESSNFYIFDHQTPRFMRKVPTGGDAVTKMLSTEISTSAGPVRLTEIEAEEMKITGCLPQSGEKKLEHIDALVRPAVERISSEIARSIQFYRDNVGQKVDAVYITGGTSCLPALKKHLESALVLLPVKVIDPFAGLNFADTATRNYAEKNKARLALAVGLALTEAPAISLMPKSEKIMKRFAAFMPGVVLALLLAAFLPLAAGGTCQAVKIKNTRSTITQYQTQAQQAADDRRHLETLQQQFRVESDHYAALQRLVGRAPLWPGIFNALAGAFSGNIVLTRFNTGFDRQHARSEFGQANLIILQGHVLPSAAGFDNELSRLLSALSASPFFKEVNIINAQSHPTGNMLGSFEIQCELIY
ncbi:MAG: pilus assembly protein PilM [Kiritimatiellae bacterium]|nr:pilus assembly protein PilM [Kiritimatiellia bacterium]